MPITKSPSRSVPEAALPAQPAARCGRRGFTLVELLVAMGIGVVVMVMVANAYSGADKAQAVAVGSSYLKLSGAATVNTIYQRLHQTRMVFDRGTTANSWLARTPIQNLTDLSSGDPLICSPGPMITSSQLEMVLPKILATPAFNQNDASDNPNASFDATAVGNAILFISTEPKITIGEASGATHPLNLVFGTSTYQFSVYKLNLYYIAPRLLPVGGAQIRPGSTYTYQLMSWRSRPFVDYNEVKSWMTKLMGFSFSPAYDPRPYIDAKLTAIANATPQQAGMAVGSGKVQGAIDLGQPDASLAGTPPVLYKLQAASSPDHLDLVSNTTDHFITEDFRAAIKFATHDAYAESMVAFNTVTPPSPPGPAMPLSDSGIHVPAYADGTSDKRPYGFEVMVGGPSNGQEILLRLTLAAKARTSRVMLGEAFQQVVQVYQY